MRSRSAEEDALPIERPTLAAIAPDWAEMMAKRQAMLARAAEIERELMRITPIVCKAGLYHTSLPGIGYVPLPPAAPPPPNERVVSLLGRFLPAKKEPEPECVYADDDPRALKAHAAELSKELEAIRAAGKLLDEPMERARLTGSAELCRQLTPEYQIIADRVCNAILEFGQAVIAHEAWLVALRRQGAAYSMLRPLLAAPPESPGDPIFALLRLLEWAAEGGAWFDPARIPSEWRKRA